MGTTPKRRVLSSASLSSVPHYRPKIINTSSNQELEKQSADTKRQQQKHNQHHRLQSPPHPLHTTSACSFQRRSSTSPPIRRFRCKYHQSKQSQPALFKQLVWKAKIAPPTSEVLLQHQRSLSNNDDEDGEEDEEAIFAEKQRQAQKLLACKVGMLAGSKGKAVISARLTSSETFVAESSSQETQSGSEDEVLFMPYSGMLSAAQSPAQWPVFKQQKAETIKGRSSSPVVPSKAIEMPIKAQENRALSKKKSFGWKRRQNCEQKQKQRRVLAKEQKRVFCEKKEVHMRKNKRSCSIDTSAALKPDSDNVAIRVFHPPVSLATGMDAEVCHAVLSQLEEVVSHIVVGDVACPIASNEQLFVRVGVSGKGQAVDIAVEDIRQRVIVMLERSQMTRMHYRESFVLDNSGFDAASSYDFLKSRFLEIQRSANIVYF